MNHTTTVQEAERTAILNAVWESIDQEWLDAGFTYAELEQADKTVAYLDQQLVAGRPLDDILAEISAKEPKRKRPVK